MPRICSSSIFRDLSLAASLRSQSSPQGSVAADETSSTEVSRGERAVSLRYSLSRSCSAAISGTMLRICSSELWRCPSSTFRNPSLTASLRSQFSSQGSVAAGESSLTEVSRGERAELLRHSATSC